jgi:hypothetical protein
MYLQSESFESASAGKPPASQVPLRLLFRGEAGLFLEYILTAYIAQAKISLTNTFRGNGKYRYYGEVGVKNPECILVKFPHWISFLYYCGRSRTVTPKPLFLLKEYPSKKNLI